LVYSPSLELLERFQSGDSDHGQNPSAIQSAA
jgi:hypothetical protein